MRLLGAALVAGGFAACSGNPEVIGEDPNGNSGTGGVVGVDGGPLPFGDASPDPNCKKRTCEEVQAQCGEIADGCTGTVDCGTCPSGQGCSLVTENQCADLSGFCTPITKDVACAGKTCGVEGDGCGGSFDCGACTATQACGVDEPFVCGAKPPPITTDNCPSKITSCKSVGKRCGSISNGCGGLLDCTAELGACPAGTVCGGKTAYQCDAPTKPSCTPATSCAELGWACGIAFDDCGTPHDCGAEGRRCGALETCVGGITGPTECKPATGVADCPLCASVPSCVGRPQLTRLTGRVITPGRADNDTGNQVGVPNAFVYILRANDLAKLPAIPSGIPANGTRCDRCDAQDLGPVLASATTTATGAFTIEGAIPVGTEFLLVVKAGKFRRATRVTLPANAACTTTTLAATLPNNPTRLPRTMADGLAVNLPRIAITTGIIDAMECVFSKMGIANAEFANPGANGAATQRVHLYRGGQSAPGQGARIDDNTPYDAELYGNLSRMLTYDMIVSDCEGQTWDGDFSERDANGGNVRQFVNRGGRLFASHLSFSWLHQNSSQAYSAATAATTGLAQAATWDTSLYQDTQGTGRIAFGRPRAAARLQTFADWAQRENLATPPNYTFSITDPRSTNTGLGNLTEEFVYRTDGNQRTQQFSFNTPYGAPAAAVCGRVAYSGFHVAATGGANNPFADVVFPNHCGGSLTAQEKVLLYQLFDLGACVGTPPTASCQPRTCPAGACGKLADGCGGSLDCGTCPTNCNPTTCAEQGVECGSIGNSCGTVLDCGTCAPGKACGVAGPGKCGDYGCKAVTCQDVGAECGNIGNGCGALIDCGPCPDGEACGLQTPFKCSPVKCTPKTCAEQNAECGTISDGCGRILDCGDCRGNAPCGSETPNQCPQIQ